MRDNQLLPDEFRPLQAASTALTVLSASALASDAVVPIFSGRAAGAVALIGHFSAYTAMFLTLSPLWPNLLLTLPLNLRKAVWSSAMSRLLLVACCLGVGEWVGPTCHWKDGVLLCEKGGSLNPDESAERSQE